MLVMKLRGDLVAYQLVDIIMVTLVALLLLLLLIMQDWYI